MRIDSQVDLTGPQIAVVGGAQARITTSATAREGVTAQRHSFGGVEFEIGKPKIEYIRDDHLVGIPFPKCAR